MNFYQVPLSWDNISKKNNDCVWIGGELILSNNEPIPDFLVKRELNPNKTHTSSGVCFSSEEESSLADLPSFKVRKQIASELTKIRLKKEVENSQKTIVALRHVYFSAITTYYHLLNRNDEIAVQAILDNSLFIFASMTEQDFQNNSCRSVANILKSWFLIYSTIARGDPLATTRLVKRRFAF